MTDTEQQEPQRQIFPQPAASQSPGPGVLNRDAPPAPAVGPSTTQTVDHLAEVMVDQWGHRGEYIRGDVLDRSQVNPGHYDWDHAVTRGTLRPLTHAEARVWGGGSSTTQVTAADGSPDADVSRSTRAAAGIPEELPETVTGPQGMPEPAEFSKPTLAFAGDNQPAARPIRTAGQDAADATTGTGRPSSTELVAQAKAAQTTAELDRIDGQADARMTTVHDAIAARRAELAQQG
jgi:hypothetical protein